MEGTGRAGSGSENRGSGCLFRGRTTASNFLRGAGSNLSDSGHCLAGNSDCDRSAAPGTAPPFAPSKVLRTEPVAPILHPPSNRNSDSFPHRLVCPLPLKDTTNRSDFRPANLQFGLGNTCSHRSTVSYLLFVPRIDRASPLCCRDLLRT